jgi:hypothetical protein
MTAGCFDWDVFEKNSDDVVFVYLCGGIKILCKRMLLTE